MNYKGYIPYDYLLALIIGGILILVYKIFYSKKDNNKSSNNSLFKCPLCGSPMKKMYNNDKAHEIAQNSKLDYLLKDMYEFQLLRIFVCVKCGFNRELKAGEIIKGFLKMKKQKGISTKDIIKEVKAERERIEDDK